ncbi:uncharacterized protein MYCFIDRAFT_75134 [Pseudocercospora fijiensis CIRAD86]|uniref:DUF7587 domain-containing protein n=1 Tax=Pseudocercospora fijiensis (strain CIRAD86) TaxID=383855 RepID=N1Q8R0_PSEFD|nr:uncharacterized protein MYCFIDRAFT_75134 [Pseudocercospora fijiensis CIRAD86]EME87268.1 hypothetical protein MYCFIDRAFT_75134 [Pseudocercospora fijiensis CIRAD86]
MDDIRLHGGSTDVSAPHHQVLGHLLRQSYNKKTSKNSTIAMAHRSPRSDIGKTRRSNTFKWSDDMRVFLHVLYTDFTYSKSENAIIFSSVFGDEVRQHGATNDRLQVLMTAQIRERNQMRAKIWVDICRTSLDAAELERRERFRAKIQEIAPSSKGHSTRRPQLGTSCTTPALRPPSKASRAIDPTSRALVPVIRRQQPVQNRNRITSLAKQTPSPKRSNNVTAVQKVQFTQFHGNVIDVTPKNRAQITKDLIPVQAQEAHPLMGGLVFRYWAKDRSSGINSENGFVARKYANRVIFPQPPPSCTSLDWTELFYHIDRIGIQEKFESPYISVSNSMIWTIRLALREIEDNPGCQGRISVIDASSLARGSLYYVPPYHREMKKSFEFTAGSWRYAGTHEFIVWKEIPRRAMLHTFTVKDLMQFVQHSEVLRETLRFDLITMTLDLKSRIIPALEQRNLGLTSELVEAFARLANLMGFTTQSSIEHISNLLCELCQGWAINLVRHTDSQWNHLAGIFSNALFTADGRPPNVRDEMCLKRGFLDGVAFGSSAHFNTRHSEKTINLMYKQARAIGLGDPGKIIMDELASAQLALMMFEKRQQKTLPGYKTQLLLQGPANDEGFASADEEEEENEEDTMVVNQPMLRNRAVRFMMEEDATMDSDDEMVSYEFGDDGRVV